MYLSVKTAKARKYFSFMESYRKDGKVKKRVVLNLGNYDNAFHIIKSDYPEFLSDLEKYAEVVPTKQKVVPTKKYITPTTLRFCDMSNYQSKFEQKVVAVYKDRLQKGTRFILESSGGYIQAYLYDGDGMLPSFWDKPEQNRYKRHWMVGSWIWESIESVNDFIQWYDDLLD